MDLVCHGRARFFPVGGADDGVELLFLLLLSIGVGSGEDRRWMDLLQAGVGSGVFGGAGSGAPSVRLGFLFTLCVRWGGLCTPVCLVWAGGGVDSSGLFFRWPGPFDNGSSPLLDLDVGAAEIHSA